MGVRRNEPIKAWSSGDVVQGFALVSRKEARQDRNNRTYLDLRLSDASGSMDAKVWTDSPALNAEFEAHDFVALKGTVKLYRDQLQMSVDECRVATEDDRRYGFDEAKLVPSTREDVDDLWRRLGRAVALVERPALRRLAEHALDKHGEALKGHPAAKSMHHAYRGGLLEHVTSMAELAVRVCGHYPQLDRDVVLVGVLFHDLGKIRELGAMPANDYTLEGRMVGHVVIGRDLLRDCCAEVGDVPDDLQLHLEHLVLSHQGRKEYASPVEPMTPEALVLHFIDDLDSKLNQLEGTRQDGAGLHWHRGLGRYVWLAEGTEVWDGAEAAPLDGYGDFGDAPAAAEPPGRGGPDENPEPPVAPAFHPSTVAGSEGGPGDEAPAGPRPADPGPPDADETVRPATRGLFD
jgi:3'-5' exoribonuclease